MSQSRKTKANRETIPLGGRLTVGQFMAIYRWRGILDVADKAYDIWRIIRMMNPATAVAQELREKFTRQLYDWGRKELARQLTTAYVREVGRGAIDLYSGRLRDLSQRAAPTPNSAPQDAQSATLPGNEPRAVGNSHAATSPPPQQRRKRFAAFGRVLRQTSNTAKLLFGQKDANKPR